MILTHLPSSLAAFFSAVEGRDAQTLSELFDAEAALSGLFSLPVAEGVTRWCSSGDAEGITLHPVNAEARDGKMVVTVLVRRALEEAGFPRALQIDLRFSFQSGKIAALDLAVADPLATEPLLRAFVDAVNAGDANAMLASFDDDAMVNDQLEEFWGLEALREWANAMVEREHLAIFVRRVRRHHGCVILRVNVEGDYDKRQLPASLPLSFYFLLREQRITQLMILLNHTEGPD